MARFANGWIKLYRRALEGDLGQNVYLWAIWTTLLSWATRIEQKRLIDGEQRTLPPGTVVFGITELATRWGCSKSTVSKWLRYLALSERIALERRTNGCIATIRNWEEYQFDLVSERTQDEQSPNEVRTPSEHGANPIGEVKKKRKNTARTGVRAEYTAAFEEAWTAFGKEGKKADASKAFEELKLSADEFQSLLVAIRFYLADCKAKDRRSMYMGTFLREDWREWTEAKAPIGQKLKTLEEIEREGLFCA